MEISDLVYLDATGYHYADYPSFLQYFTQKYQGIYGADIVLDDSSQDGQSVAIEAKAAYDSAAKGAAVFNSFSPSTAQGLGLARVVKINGLTKRVATNSTVDVTIGGTVGTTITSGVAQDGLNQLWNLPATVVIPFAGTIIVTATAAVSGAIAALPGTVTKIFTPTQGWQTVTNVGAAILGQPIETDAQLRKRQTISTANPSLTVLEGTMGAVLNVAGVTDGRPYENDTDTTDADGIPSHSIAIIADGGDSVDIAQAILDHKGPGCGTYGTTSETVTDQKGIPSVINFFRSTQKIIDVEISYHPFTGFLSGYLDLIANAVADAIGSATSEGLGIGNDVLITKLYTPANLPGNPAGATYDITLIRIKIHGVGSFGTANLPMNFNWKAFCDANTNVSFILT